MILWGDPMTLAEYRARIERRSKAMSALAALLFYLASIAIAYEKGLADRAWVVAKDAEQRAYEASVEAGR